MQRQYLTRRCSPERVARDSETKPLYKLLRATPSILPAVIDARKPGVWDPNNPNAPHIHNQLKWGSCSIFGTFGATHLHAWNEGYQIPRPSFAAGYNNVLAAQFPYPAPLEDVGANIGNVIDILGEDQTSAIVKADDYPYTEENLLQRVPLDVYQAGIGIKVEFYRLTGSGSSLWESIRQALNANHPVVFGMEVDKAYEDLGAQVYEGPTGPSLGGHCQYLYKADHDVSIGAGSWGTEAFDEGSFRIHKDFLVSRFCFDFYAAKTSPKVLR